MINWTSKRMLILFDFIEDKGIVEYPGRIFIVELLLKEGGEYTITDIANKTNQSYRNTQRHVYALLNNNVLEVSKYTNGKKYLKISNKFYSEMNKVEKKFKK